MPEDRKRHASLLLSIVRDLKQHAEDLRTVGEHGWAYSVEDVARKIGHAVQESRNA